MSLRQKDLEFEASVDYIDCLKKKKRQVLAGCLLCANLSFLFSFILIATLCSTVVTNVFIAYSVPVTGPRSHSVRTWTQVWLPVKVHAQNDSLEVPLEGSDATHPYNLAEVLLSY
jgi:hypothetical protein